jgi:Xaa-Pro aminopeptidase
MEVPDPYTWYMDTKGETHIILSSLEVGRGRKEAKVDHVHAMDDIKLTLRAAHTPVTESQIIYELIAIDKPDVVDVPEDFPAGLFVSLKGLGAPLQPVRSFIFPERAIKTADEIEKIRTAQLNNQRGFERAFRILKEATIASDNTLAWKGTPLTSEILRGEMNARVAQFGSIPMAGGPIVACGAQGADPHERGHGVLYAHEFIIIDSFPRADNFYYGDLTRTVLKGKASQWHLDVYEAVKAAQQVGLDIIKEGITGADVHAHVDNVLKKAGFDTGKDANGDPYGFFHGTGHALGLDVHDKGPGVSPRNTDPLKAGMVVTVEPGLYYAGKGGVRIEDIVAVTKDGIDNLTTLHKTLIID